MSGPIGDRLRRLVAICADRLCEYCLIHEEDAFFPCEVDHVISRKHGGPTAPGNLAYACFFCNRQKGSDIASLIWPSRRLVPLFNPRTDRWGAHFRLEGGIIAPVTDTGQVTVRLLGVDHGDRVVERIMLIEAGRYPRPAALARARR